MSKQKPKKTKSQAATQHAFNNKEGGPLDPLKVPRFGGIATFSRLPFEPNPIKGSADIAVLGIPYDGGTSYRPGARFAPRAIRAASALNRNHNPHQEVTLFERTKVIDVGDVAVNPISILKTLKSIEAHCLELHQKGLKIVAMGGDHSVALGELRAIRQTFGKPIVIHFDAHNDTGDEAWGEKYHHGTPFRRAIEEGLIDGKDLFQIGIRGPLTDAKQYNYIEEQGIQMLDMDQFSDLSKRKAFFEKIKKQAGKRPCFITFDVDGIDPAFAPGTGTPVVGGMTSREALECIRMLKGIHLIGADVVEVSPAYDHSDLTSLLAAALMFEMLCLMAN